MTSVPIRKGLQILMVAVIAVVWIDLFVTDANAPPMKTLGVIQHELSAVHHPDHASPDGDVKVVDRGSLLEVSQNYSIDDIGENALFNFYRAEFAKSGWKYIRGYGHDTSSYVFCKGDIEAGLEIARPENIHNYSVYVSTGQMAQRTCT